MNSNYNIKPRKKLRLFNYDYKTPGYYFVTFCTNNRDCLFGKIINGILYLNDPGKMVCQAIESIPTIYNGWIIDTFVVMPNHVHAIAVLSGLNHECISLPDLVHNIKSYTTNKYIKGVLHNNWPQFYEKLWQKSYYDHIVRDRVNLIRIRKYILDNPLNWENDADNPININM